MMITVMKQHVNAITLSGLVTVMVSIVTCGAPILPVCLSAPADLVFRYHDSRWINQKESVLTHADTIRMILPSLMESMTAYIKNLSSHHAKLARDTFCSAMENSINGIISSYK